MLIKEKENMRKWARSERSRLNLGQLAMLLIFNIRRFERYKTAKNVMIFHPLKDEINLLALLEDDKLFCFPRIIDNQIVPYQAGKAYIKGAFGIMEPFGTEEIAPEKIDLIIVPALAIDKKGNRVGYGKGYYDEFLRKIDREKTTLICALPQALLVENIAAEAQDVSVDCLITEKGIRKFRV